MDERLSQHFDWSKGLPGLTNLCIYAVLLARIDSERGTADITDELANIHLAQVLALGFNPAIMIQINSWDMMRSLHELNRLMDAHQRVRVSSQVGAECLFLASQGLWTGRSPEHTSLRSVSTLGASAYQVAAANCQTQQKEIGRLYARISNQFAQHSQLLGTAGALLGFEPDILKLIDRPRSVTTIEDVLDAISTFGTTPTKDAWTRLASAVTERQWSDPEFVYDLPPCPTN